MARKITMTGDKAQYIENRAKEVVADDREIRMEGEHARYEEHAGTVVAHYPLYGDSETGLRQYEFLVRGGYIANTTHEQHFLYLMGYTTNQPEGVKPIEWLTTKEQLHKMLQRRFQILLEKKELTDELTNTQLEVDKTYEGLSKKAQEAVAALDQATADYVMFCDADDRFINDIALSLIMGACQKSLPSVLPPELPLRRTTS